MAVTARRGNSGYMIALIMKIWKNLFGTGDKIHADEVVRPFTESFSGQTSLPPESNEYRHILSGWLGTSCVIKIKLVREYASPAPEVYDITLCCAYSTVTININKAVMIQLLNQIKVVREGNETWSVYVRHNNTGSYTNQVFYHCDIYGNYINLTSHLTDGKLALATPVSGQTTDFAI